MHSVRFDMRVPGKSPGEIADHYQAAIDMARWMDEQGGFSLAISEHHAAEDGYTPSPITLASAMAAVTNDINIMVAATLLPLHDPVRLAEEMIVLDYVSRGRTSYVLGIGYRPEEYELYGLEYGERGRIADKKLARLLDVLDGAKASTAMPRVTPAPFSPAHPILFWGGGSKAAARRAGRFGLGFLAQVSAPGLDAAYQEACSDAGNAPGLCMIPPADMPGVVFVADDVDRGWEEIGPYMLADAVSYAEWNERAKLQAAVISRQTSVNALREENGKYRIVDVAGAMELIEQWGRLPLHPLCGGCPPELAWPCLRRVVEEVRPAVGGN